MPDFKTFARLIAPTTWKQPLYLHEMAYNAAINGGATPDIALLVALDLNELDEDESTFLQALVEEDTTHESR